VRLKRPDLTDYQTLEDYTMALVEWRLAVVGFELPPVPEPDIMAVLKRSLAEKRARRNLLAAAIDETASRYDK
jgi:hypothetical protein